VALALPVQRRRPQPHQPKPRPLHHCLQTGPRSVQGG